MFNVTPGMEQAWRDLPKPKATAADIARIESVLGIKLSASYVEFVTRYGFVVFGRDPEDRSMFRYTIDAGGQKETRQGDIRALFRPDKLLLAHRNMTTAESPDDETRPMIPPGYLPIASDAGQGAILLDVAGHPGQVWYWRENPVRWGLDDNTVVGFVAEDFEAFINGLLPYQP